MPCTLRYSSQYIIYTFLLSDLSFLLTWRRDQHSRLPGLPLFWSEATKSPAMEFEKWVDLSAVVVIAKLSISIEELTSTVVNDHPRVKSLLGKMAEGAADKKVATLLFMSLGEPAKKLFKDKYPEISIWTLQVRA